MLIFQCKVLVTKNIVSKKLQLKYRSEPRCKIVEKLLKLNSKL